MDFSPKAQRPSNIRKMFILVWLNCLLFVPNYLSPKTASTVHATEIRWRKEHRAVIDGRVSDCAWTGGMELSKPTFVDIDGDGDLDMFIGGEDGRISCFQNDGTKDEPSWHFISDYYDSIDAGDKSAPFFADTDDDGDFDLFVGNAEGVLLFYQNDGGPSSPHWTKITNYYDSIDVGANSVPSLVDVDADSDLDLFIGEKAGNINFYQNDGTGKNPLWNLISEVYDLIDIGACSAPFFVDIDNDGDFDLFIGEEYGNINFFRNTGTANSPQWDSITSNYNSINVGRHSIPAFVDIDHDSDFDLFTGQKQGRIHLYRNDGDPWLPQWYLVTENYNFVDLGSHTKPALADIDADGDLDLFIGEKEGNINFYRNQAALRILSCTLVTENYYAIEAEDYSQPTFADIDSDDDLDLFVGKDDGGIQFYENTGSPDSPSWMLVTDNYHSIDVGGYSSPAFVDIDADSDLDLFIGQTHGKIFFYRNDGSPHLPSWTLVSEDYNSIDAGNYSVPTFADLDSDGDFDLLIGNDDGRILFYQNQGTSQADSFVFVTEYYDSIDVGGRSTSFLCDLDSDGDPELFIGEVEGGLHFYRNLTLNSIRGRVTDGENNPVAGAAVFLSGDRKDTTFTDVSGNYGFIGLPIGDYCVFRDPGIFQYCFTPLESDTFDIDFSGTTEISEEVDPYSPSPKVFHLHQNYPNPFNPTTAIRFQIGGGGYKFDTQSCSHVALKIYNLRGKLVRTLVDQELSSGSYRVIWDGKDANGDEVASGIYFCQLRIGSYCQTKKMMLLK